MRKISLLILIAATLTCCNKKEEKKVVKTEIKETIKKKESALEIQSFEDLPEEIDGPGCNFSFSEKDYRKGGRYIYSDNLDSICYIKIKGDFVRLRMVDIDTSWFPNMHYAKKFRNEDYQLSVDVKKVDEEDEVSLLKGIMLIKYKDEPGVKKELYGYCGC